MTPPLKLALLGCLAAAASSQATFDASRYVWDNKESVEWERNTFPIGNGRLAANIWGTMEEQLSLNEETGWSVPYANRTSPGSKAAVPTARQMLMDGEITAAGDFIMQQMTPTVIPFQGSHSVIGFLTIDFNHPDTSVPQNYTRWLDTQEGLTAVSYTLDGVTYSREYLASFPQNVITGQFTADKSGALTITASLSRQEGVVVNTATSEGGVSEVLLSGMNGDSNNPVLYSVKARFESDGAASVSGSSLTITGATTISLYIDMQTNYRYPSRTALEAEIDKNLAAAVKVGYNGIRTAAIQDFTNLSTRAAVDLGASDSALTQLPTDQRVAQARKSLDDPQLLTLLFNFGRYMLISGSRKSSFTDVSMPLNLQGKWNNYTQAPFGSKYTMNINIEMLYWSALSANLFETMEPLWDLAELARQKGEGQAASMYGCPGIVAFHNWDIYGDGAPTDGFPSSTMWPMSALWVGTMMTDYYLYTGDEDFLRDTALPFLLQILDFLQCYCYEYNGYLVTGPTLSAEVTFEVPSAMSTAGSSAAMDMDTEFDNRMMQQICEDILFISEVLGLSDSAGAKAAAEFLPKVRPPRITAEGRLQEWREDYPQNNAGSSHLSPAVSLHPLLQISPLKNSTLSEAARGFLDFRKASGGAGCGWGQTWFINQYARLLDGETAWSHVLTFVQNFVMPNLFDSLGTSTFQLDGNLGFVSGLTETLVQSDRDGHIHLLPALMMDGMPSGSCKGLRTRTGHTVDMQWENGVLVAANVTASRESMTSLTIGNGAVVNQNKKRGHGFTVDGEPYTGPFSAIKGRKYAIKV